MGISTGISTGKLYCRRIFKNSRSSLSRRSAGTKRSANGHRECNFYSALAAFLPEPAENLRIFHGFHGTIETARRNVYRAFSTKFPTARGERAPARPTYSRPASSRYRPITFPSWNRRKYFDTILFPFPSYSEASSLRQVGHEFYNFYSFIFLSLDRTNFRVFFCLF